MSSGDGDKYWAFISYSHHDRQWAEWLHRQLETYRVPRRLVGQAGRHGPLPGRLFPVFRDIEELPSSPDLSAVIDRALLQSRHLIVIASPHSAASRWVDQEIRRFRELGRGDRILCLIVDGEPHASERPASGRLECFPPSLREAGREPIGADLRAGGEGRAAAKLKLIAGLLGIEFDALRQRERQRLRWRRALGSAAAMLFGLLAALAWKWEDRERERALQQQAQQVRIAALYERGRQELQARNEMRAAVYLEEAYKLGLDTPALRFMLRRAMNIVDSALYDLRATDSAVVYAELSPDSTRLLTVDGRWEVRVWSLRERRELGRFDVPDPSWWYYPEFDHGSDTLSYHMIPADGGPGVLRVVDADSVRQLAEVQTPRNFEFVSGAVEPGGHRVVYVGLDDAVHRYDWRAARDQRVVEGRFALAAYSRDGRWIVTGRANGRVELWDAHTAAHMATFEGLGARITSVATSADGRWLAAADESGAVRLWGLECRCLVLMSGHRGRAFVRFDALGRHMVSNAADGTRLWDIASRTLVYSAQYAGVTVEQSRFSRDAGWIAHPGDARLAIHESATGRELFTLDGHAGAPTNVFFGEGGRHIATAGSDGRVVVWNTPRIPLIEFQHPVSYSQLYDSRQDDPSIAVAFSARGLLASGGMDGNVRLRDAATLRPQPDLAGDGSPISALAFNPDGTRLAVASEHSLRLYDGEGALLNAAALQRHVLAMRYAGSSMLMLALKNHGWALWDAQALRLRLGGERDQAGASGLSPDGTRFAYGWQGVVHLLDLRSGRELWTRAIEEAPGVPSRELAVLEFDTRGARLAVSSLRATTVVLDAADGRLLASARDDSSSELETLRFSPDGAALLITDGNRSARLWRWRQNDEHRLDAHSAPLRGGAFSADGALAFTWGQDGKVYAWDAAHGELLDRVGFHAVNLAFDSVAVDPGDQRLASASIDGIVRVWDISRETRDAAALAVQLRCRAPWTVRETELVSQPPAGGCESRADLAPD